MSSLDLEVYQIVYPEPEANERCCLNGRNSSCVGGGVRVSGTLETDASGWVVGWALCPDCR